MTRASDTRGNLTRRSRGCLAAGAFVAALALVPWTLHLARTLPAHHRAAHWNVAWTGFDMALAGCFAATAWAARRRHPMLGPCLWALGVLLACDAWLDLATALGTDDGVPALLEACIELPLSATALLLGATIAVASPTAPRRPVRGSRALRRPTGS